MPPFLTRYRCLLMRSAADVSRKRRKQALAELRSSQPQSRIRVAKQQPHCPQPLSAVLPSFRHAQRLVDDPSRGGVEPMKLLNPRKTDLLPGIPASGVASSRLWLSETSLRALARRWDRFLRET